MKCRHLLLGGRQRVAAWWGRAKMLFRRRLGFRALGRLPDFAVPVGFTTHSYLARLAEDGLRDKLRGAPAKTTVASTTYEERLTCELELLRDAGLSNYILILQDLMGRARAQGIPVGPGHGSAPSSLAAYALGISEPDPVRYGLLFERFLHAGLTVLPDIQIDVCAKRRIELVHYLAQRYGAAHVAVVATPTKFRSVGGIVITKCPVTAHVPLRPSAGEESGFLQVGGDDIDQAGLARLDLFPLRALTRIHRAIQLVNHGHSGGQPLALGDIPLDDPAALALISRGDTSGVFQMESAGFTEMVKSLEPSCFEDIIAAGALYRPGPLDRKLPGTDVTMVQAYIERKHGRMPVAYPHPKVEPILKETYGAIVYQEQVMRVIQVLAGYSLGRADLLRRAIGKKKAEVMQKERAGFLEGSVQNGMPEKVAGEIFDVMEELANYGFNKSHSAAYAVISMQTAWLKAHHRVEFMAALLSSEKGNTDMVARHIAEARAAGLAVLPPDVNESELDCSVTDGKIRFGMEAIKGVGESAIEAIVAARKSGPFKGLFDFCERCDLRKIDKKTVEALIKAGAFDFAKVPRRRLFDAIDPAVDRGQSAQNDRAIGQSSLFGALSGQGGKKTASEAEEYGKAEEWVEKDRLRFEKEAIGFYITGHPLAQYTRELSRYARPCAKVQQMRKDEKTTVAGVIVALRERVLRDGRRMAFGTLEDLSGSVEVLFFPGKDGSRSEMRDGKWQKGQARPGFVDWEVLLKGDVPVLVKGTVQQDRRDVENPKAEVVAEAVESLSVVRA